MLRQLTLSWFLCAALCACGGGSTSTLPKAPSTGPGSAGTSSVVIAIKIPAAVATTSTAVRQPQYVSAGTQSATIAINTAAPVTVNLTSTSPNCTGTSGGRTCTVTVSAPVGTDTFVETLYAGTNATGAVLSQGRTSATIVAGTANTVTLSLSGVIASLSLALTNATQTVGTPGTIGLTVNFLDASGDAIIGSQPFATPITLSDNDPSGATALSKTTLNSPADGAALTIPYNGSAMSGPATFTATSGTITASATFKATAATSGPVTFNDYTTFGYDNARDVYNPNTTAITPASVPNIHLAWQSALGGGDYNTQTQPVLATEIAGHQGVLFVGGGTGNVYGYDATTGNLLWTRATGQETYTCEGNNTIYFGVGGTVAYDPGSKSLYVVGNTNPSPNAIATNSLYHLDGASGAVLGQVSFAPPLAGWNSLDFSHTAVTLGSNGLAYVGTGATCDISSWRGRVAAISVPSMTLYNTFFPVWNGTTQPWGGGGIWGWGGVSLDSNGNVYTGVGNTDNGSTTQGKIVAPFQASPDEYSGLGESFVKLSADLSTVEDSQHPIPTSAYSGNSVDLDLQGTPVLFQPTGACDPMAGVQGKSGTLYVYDTARLGSGPRAQYELAPSSYEDSFLGGPAYSPATGLLYDAIPSGSGSLFPPGLLAINPGCGTPSVAWTTVFGPNSNGGLARSVPAVSAGGVVFVGTPCSPDGNGGCSGDQTSSTARSAQGAQRKPAICCAPPGSSGGAVWAINASTGDVLNGGLPVITTSGPIRVPPTIDGNWIFVLDNNGDMYGLTIDPSYAAIATKTRAISSRMLRQWEAQPGLRGSNKN